MATNGISPYVPIVFPPNPAIDEEWQAPNGVTYRWDGTVWIAIGMGNALDPRYVEKAGDTMSGDLWISNPTDGTGHIRISGSDQESMRIRFRKDGVGQWMIDTNEAHLRLINYTPDGVAKGVPFQIADDNRSILIQPQTDRDPTEDNDLVRLAFMDSFVQDGLDEKVSKTGDVMTGFLQTTMVQIINDGDAVLRLSAPDASFISFRLGGLALQPQWWLGVQHRVGTPHQDSFSLVRFTDPTDITSGDVPFEVRYDTGDVNLPIEGTGYTFGISSQDGGLYKRVGGGIVLRRSTGNEQPAIEDNNANQRWDIIDTRGGTFDGSLFFRKPGIGVGIAPSLQWFDETAAPHGELAQIVAGRVTPTLEPSLAFRLNHTLGGMQTFAQARAGNPVAHLELLAEPQNDSDAATKRYVDRSMAGTAQLIGVFEAPTDTCHYRPDLPHPSPGPLVSAAAAGTGSYLICDEAGAMPPTSVIPGMIFVVGDWVISDGVNWTRLRVGGVATSAGNVGVIPPVAGGDNAQDALEGLEAQKVAIAGDTMTGPLVINAQVPALTVSAQQAGGGPAPAIRVIDVNNGADAISIVGGGDVRVTDGDFIAWIDGHGLETNSGGRFYKRGGNNGPVTIRAALGNAQPQIENNDGSNRRDILDANTPRPQIAWRPGANYTVGQAVVYDNRTFVVLQAINNAPTIPDFTTIMPVGYGQTDYWHGNAGGDLALWVAGNWVLIATVPAYGTYRVEISDLHTNNDTALMLDVVTGFNTATAVLAGKTQQGTGSWSEVRLSQATNGGAVRIELRVGTRSGTPNFKVFVQGETRGTTTNSVAIPKPLAASAANIGGTTRAEIKYLSIAAFSTSHDIIVGDQRTVRYSHANAVDANDGKIGARLFAAGLNIVGSQTETTGAETGRHLGFWGNITMRQNNSYLRWLGTGSTPAVPSYGTRSTGTRVVIYDNLSATAADYAIGIAGNELWLSTPGAGTNFIGFFMGNQRVARIDNTGLTIASDAQKYLTFNRANATNRWRIHTGNANDDTFSVEALTNAGTRANIFTIERQSWNAHFAYGVSIGDDAAGIGLTINRGNLYQKATINTADGGQLHQWQDAAGRRTGQFNCTQTGGIVGGNPEGRMELWTNNGGWGWQRVFHTTTASPPLVNFTGRPLVNGAPMAEASEVNRLRFATTARAFSRVRSEGADAGIGNNPPTLRANSNSIHVSNANWTSPLHLPAINYAGNGDGFFFESEASNNTVINIDRTSMEAPLTLANGNTAVFILNAVAGVWDYAGTVANNQLPPANKVNMLGNSYTMPGNRGTNGQVLQTNGTGAASWSNSFPVGINFGSATASSAKDLTRHIALWGGASPTADGFGFNIQSGVLNYVTAATNNIHDFYCGANHVARLGNGELAMQGDRHVRARNFISNADGAGIEFSGGSSLKKTVGTNMVIHTNGFQIENIDGSNRRAILDANSGVLKAGDTMTGALTVNSGGITIGAGNFRQKATSSSADGGQVHSWMDSSDRVTGEIRVSQNGQVTGTNHQGSFEFRVNTGGGIQRVAYTRYGANPRLALDNDPVNPEDVATRRYTDTKVARNGDAMTGDLNMQGNRIINVGDPVTDLGAANKRYVDSQSAGGFFSQVLSSTVSSGVRRIALFPGGGPNRLSFAVRVTRGNNSQTILFDIAISGIFNQAIQQGTFAGHGVNHSTAGVLPTSAFRLYRNGANQAELAIDVPFATESAQMTMEVFEKSSGVSVFAFEAYSPQTVMAERLMSSNGWFAFNGAA